MEEKSNPITYKRGPRLDFTLQSERVKKVVKVLLENPKASNDEIVSLSGLTKNAVNKVLYGNNYIKTFRMFASGKVRSLIPLAIKGLKECLESTSDTVKLDAAVTLLKSERILGSEKVDVTIDDTRQRSIDEMREIIKRAKLIPQQTIPDNMLIGTGNG